MTILSKGCKLDSFESKNSPKLSLKKYLRPLFKICWLWIFPWITLIQSQSNSSSTRHSCSMWDKLGWLNWFWQILCERLPSLNPKGFYYLCAWAFSLFERRTSFCMGLITRKPCRFLLMFSTGFTSVSVFPGGSFMPKVNNRNTRTRCAICSELTLKTPKWHLTLFLCFYC